MVPLIWVVVVSSVGANWLSRVSDRPLLETVSKPAATIAIAGLAVVVSDGTPGGITMCALIGFAFCLIGDIALLPAVDNFIAGLGAFLIGHLAFIAMFVRLGLDRGSLGAIAAATMVIVAAIPGRRIVRGAQSSAPSLTGPVIAYLLVIAAMTVTGWSTGITAALIGSTLFVVSDSILGWRAFVGERPWMPLAVMMTYHGALIGLALTLA